MVLCHYAMVGILDEVRRALAKGEDVNSKDENNRTGLMYAVWKNHNPVVILLLEQPTVDLNCTNQNGTTALHYAVDDDNVDGVRMLLADPRLASTLSIIRTGGAGHGSGISLEESAR